MNLLTKCNKMPQIIYSNFKHKDETLNNLHPIPSKSQYLFIKYKGDMPKNVEESLQSFIKVPTLLLQRLKSIAIQILKIYILLHIFFPKIGRHKNNPEIIMHQNHFPYIVQILEIT